MLSELESQNEEQLEGMSAKVKMLKDVRCSFSLSPPSLPFPKALFSFLGYVDHRP